MADPFAAFSPTSPLALYTQPTAAADLQKQMLLAKMLQDQASQDDLNPTQMAGKYVVPISPLAGLAHVGKQIASTYAQKGLLDKQMQMQQGQMTALAAAIGGTPPPSADGMPATMDGSHPMSVPQGSAPSGGFGPSGMPANQRMMAYLLDPNAYAASTMKQYEPTDLAKNVGNPATKPYMAGQLLTNVNGVPVPNDKIMQQWGGGSAPTAAPPQAGGTLPGGAADNARVNYSAIPPQPDAVTAMTGGNPPVSVPPPPAPPASGPDLGALMNPTKMAGDAAAAKASGEAAGGVQKAIDDEAAHSLESKRILDQMRNYTQNFEPGKLAEAKANLGAWAQSLGADPKQVAAQLGSVGDVQAFHKLTAQLAIQAIKQISPRATQMEFQRFLENNPNPELSPDAMNKVMDFMEKTAGMGLQKQQEFQAWKQGKSPADYQDFNAYWNKKIASEPPSPAAAAPSKTWKRVNGRLVLQ